MKTEINSRLYRSFFVPVLVFVVIIALGITVGRGMIAGILDTREEIKELGKTNKLLLAKKETLMKIDKDDYTKKAQVVILAVPDEPSGLSSMASLRSIASLSEIKLENIKIGQAGESGQVAISFQVEGSIASITAYLEKIEKAVPLTHMRKISLSAIGSFSDARVDVYSFWASLPDKLPEVASVVETLTSVEEELISKLSGLVTVVPASSPLPPAGRTNPFVF